MLLTVLPRGLDVSWQSHRGGAVAGVAAAFAFRRKDPQAPRRRYSWEIEEEQAALDAQAAAAERDQFETRAAQDVPVLRHRDDDAPETGVVLPFPRRPDARSRSEEHTSELQSLLRNSYAVFGLHKNTNTENTNNTTY